MTTKYISLVFALLSIACSDADEIHFPIRYNLSSEFTPQEHDAVEDAISQWNDLGREKLGNPIFIETLHEGMPVRPIIYGSKEYITYYNKVGNFYGVEVGSGEHSTILLTLTYIGEHTRGRTYAENVTAITLHELGHVIGYEHNNDPNSLMNGLGNLVFDDFDTITPDVVEQFCQMYKCQ